MSFSAIQQETYGQATSSPTNLYIYTGTPTVLADNSSYRIIFVQLQNASGKPARATDDITVDLSSSQTAIGSVEPAITIPKGETMAAANFTSTFNPGATVISASSTGYPTVMATIMTIGPIPAALGVYGIPATLPSDNGTYTAILVQLQDSSKAPARAPKGGVPVTLTSSDTSVGNVTSAVTIPEGETYAVADFSTTTKAAAQAKILTTTVTAISQGYTPSQVTISTTPIATNPTMMKIFSGPFQTPADGKAYNQTVIQLQNASGCVAQRTDVTTINLASTDSSICKIDSIILPPQQTFVVAPLNTTYKTGTTTLTATADNFPMTSQAVSTAGFVPSKLAVYWAQTNLPADGDTYGILQVQLQDSQGRPARAMETDVSVKLFCSQSAIGSVSCVVKIPVGQTQATVNFTTTFSQGSTTVSAQSQGYSTGQATLTTCIIDYYTITSNANGNGTVNPNGKINAIIGANQKINILANNGNQIVDVLVDNISIGPVSVYSFVNITGSHSLVANFAISTYTINITQTSNGVIDPKTSNVNYGDTPIFTITPDTGYSLSKITANGKAIPVNSTAGQTYQFSPVTNNGSLSAVFTANRYTIEVKQSSNGTISPGTTTLNYNESQTFTINPNAGCHVVDVLVNGKSVGSVTSYTVQNIKESIKITADYQTDPATPSTASPSPNPAPTTIPPQKKDPNPTASPIPVSTPKNTAEASTNSDFLASIPMEIRYILAAIVIAVGLTSGWIIKKRTKG